MYVLRYRKGFNAGLAQRLVLQSSKLEMRVRFPYPARYVLHLDEFRGILSSQ